MRGLIAIFSISGEQLMATLSVTLTTFGIYPGPANKSPPTVNEAS
jgi:hypothetical protein